MWYATLDARENNSREEETTMNKREAQREANRLMCEGGGRATIIRIEQGSGRQAWGIEYTPAPKTDNDGNRWEQPTRILG